MTKHISETVIFWFLQDLRLSDNPGFYEATQNYFVMPVFIVDETDPLKIGACSKWWLYHSLKSLDKSLNNKLNLYRGNPQEILFEIAKKNKINKIFWNLGYEPHQIQKTQEIKNFFTEKGIKCQNFSGNLLWDPIKTVKKDGTPYKIYTPFYHNACLNLQEPRHPISAPKEMILIKDNNNKITIDQIDLLPKEKWYHKLDGYWSIGEEAAKLKLNKFLANGLPGYKENRNIPSQNGVSRLSPHLHFGELSPNQIWYAVQEIREHKIQNQDVLCFLSELGWREFSYHLLYHFPNSLDKNFKKKFDHFPWRYDPFLLEAWKKGKTGYPLIDAGMRELWQTGYMHNRVRMIVASFLVKNLMQHWHYGRDWFWDCLLDADLANNSMNWQWVAGSGADASPYFRIFNPITQGEKIDPNGLYTRRLVPEVAKLSNKFLFKPWKAPRNELIKAGIILGENYPRPIVDLDDLRKQALQCYKSL